MGLNEDQITYAWERRIEAETYALYFGDLASRYSRTKQVLSFLTFFLSSGAAATVVAKSPPWVPLLLSLATAAVSAWIMATSLDSRVRSMAKLHYSWLQISGDYTKLWNHTYADEAEEELYDLMRREQDLSQLATTEAPNDQKAMARSQDQVFKMHRLTNA